MKSFICYIGCALLLFNLFVSASRAQIVTGADKVVGEISDSEVFERKANNLTRNAHDEVVDKIVDTPLTQTDTVLTQADTAQAQTDTALAQTDTTQAQIKPETTAQHIHNEIAKLFFLPFVADKVYQGDKINGDLSGLILLFYPNAQESTVRKFADTIRFFVRWKRKYDYVVKRLEHEIKAAKMLPKDAPIVAQDGEYAPSEVDLTKQSAEGEYLIRYKPYKFLEYDAGQYGEPVRRMDKNYVTTDEVTYAEILLALLKFDVGAFAKAWQKIPASTDGAGEVFQTFDDKGEIRLLADSSLLGDQKKIHAVFDILLPKGFYINGDVLNPKNKLGFLLSETKFETDKGEVYRPSQNVGAYQIYQPLADGIQDKNQQVHRVLSGRVRIPIEFERADTSKSMRVSGALRFVLCAANGDCKPIVSYHELTLRQGTPAESSIFVNYITQGFMKLPSAKSKHVKVTDALYSADKKQLTVLFEGTIDVSNMAVMVEDAYGSNFINPRYEMFHSGGKWRGKAVFDLKSSNNSFARRDISSSPTSIPSTVKGGVVASSSTSTSSSSSSSTPSVAVDGRAPLPEVAVSASFDNQEFLRAVMQPRSVDAFSTVESQKRFDVWMFFVFGVLISLMPAIFAVYFNLMALLWTKNERWWILARFAFMTALGTGGLIWGAEYLLLPQVYLSAPILTAVGALCVALIMENLGYVDFALFRPLRRFLKYGVCSALFVAVLFVFVPMPYKSEVLDLLGRNADMLSFSYRLGAGGLIWVGMMLLPLMALLWVPRTPYFLLLCQRVNLFYTALLLGWLLWICGAVYSFAALVVMATFLVLIAALWYWFPRAVGEAIKHSRSALVQAQIFFKVQQHWLFLLTCFILLAGGILFALSPIYPKPLNYTEADSIQYVNNRPLSQPVLVTLGAPYSPRSLFNLEVVDKLKRDGVKVFAVDVSKYPHEALYWLQRYQHFYPPLSVLFTQRHPYGLVLPQNLKNVDFDKALGGW